MNEKPTFKAQLRDNTGKGAARKLRAQGLIPSVCYGAGTENHPLTVDPKELYQLLTGRFGTNLVFALEVEGGPSYSHVMVRDYQVDPVRRELLHADFVVVDPNKKLQLTIPVTPLGRPAGVQEGGRLRAVRDEVEVWVSPDDIPAEVEYDVSHMGLDETTLASELELPEGCEPAYKVNYAVFRILIPRQKDLPDIPGQVEAEEAAEAEAAEGEAAEGEGEGVSEEAAPPGA